MDTSCFSKGTPESLAQQRGTCRNFRQHKFVIGYFQYWQWGVGPSAEKATLISSSKRLCDTQQKQKSWTKLISTKWKIAACSMIKPWLWLLCRLLVHQVCLWRPRIYQEEFGQWLKNISLLFIIQHNIAIFNKYIEAMYFSITLKHMQDTPQRIQSKKYQYNVSLSYVIDSFVWKIWNENNLKLSQWMFALLQCRMKQNKDKIDEDKDEDI